MNSKFYLRDRFSLALILLGIFLGFGSVLLQTSLYEASVEVALSKINYKKAGGAEEINTLIIPSVPEARRLLLRPDEITDAILVACGFPPEDKNRFKLVRSIRAYRADTKGEHIFIVIHSPMQDQAAKCASSLAGRVIDFSTLEKKEELNRLATLSDGKVFSVDAHISRPILVSDQKTSRPLYLFLGIMFSVILLGHICRNLYKKLSSKLNS